MPQPNVLNRASSIRPVAGLTLICSFMHVAALRGADQPGADGRIGLVEAADVRGLL